MDSVPHTVNTLGVLQKYIRRILTSCWGLFPCLNRHHQVHAFNPRNSRSKFFNLNTLRRIHVIHIDSKARYYSKAAIHTTSPELVSKSETNNDRSRRLSVSSNKSDASTGEYWFTRWNRPLTLLNNCNCSFRRQSRKKLDNSSLPHLTQAQETVIFNNHNETINLSINCHRNEDNHMMILSSHIETFAEDFVKDILSEALSKLALRIEQKNLCSNSNGPSPKLKVNDNSEQHLTKSQSKNLDTRLSSSSSKNEIHDMHSLKISTLDIVNNPHEKRNNSVMNANTGCVNPTFLNSLSDPDGTIAPRRTCKHVKQVSKPLLYFLHGVGSSAEVWWSQLQFFAAAGYEVVAPDMLGHGFSAAPDQAKAYTFQCLLKDSVDIFDRFVGEHGKCVVIGHGYGCSLAAAVARYRTQVTQLVLISGGGPTPLAPTHESSVFPCLQGCLKPFVTCGFKRDSLYAPCGKHMVPCDSLSHGMPRHVLRYMAMGQDWPEGDSTFHRRILVPTLLVHGMQDPHVTLVQECEMERTIPRSFLELIPDAGHLAMLETPSQLSHMIHCFIDWWAR